MSAAESQGSILFLFQCGFECYDNDTSIVPFQIKMIFYRLYCPSHTIVGFPETFQSIFPSVVYSKALIVSPEHPWYSEPN